MILYKNKNIYIEIEKSEIPWLKIFTQKGYKELSECDDITKQEIFRCMDIAEKTMLEYYKPTKINIAMFGNYLPKLHVHVMARFENDSFFPEPMWGKKQREGKLELPDFDTFLKKLLNNLQ